MFLFFSSTPNKSHVYRMHEGNTVAVSGPTQSNFLKNSTNDPTQFFILPYIV